MSVRLILDALDQAPIHAVLERMPARGTELRIGGLPGSSDAVLVAWLATRLPERLIVVITPSPAAADRWVSDLQALTDVPVALYPQREGLGEDEPHYEIAGERVETLEALLSGRLRVLVTPARATAERTPIPAVLSESTLRLHSGPGGEAATLSRVGEALDRMGYHRVPAVTEVAQYSIRGGILDVYGFGMASPARCEWWGDDLVSLRGFDLTTQRSLGELDDITVLPIAARVETLDATAGRPESPRQSLLELLPPDTLVVMEDAEAHAADVARAWNEAEHHIEVARRLGEVVPARAELFMELDVWRERHATYPRLVLAPADAPADLQMGFLPPERIDRNLNRLRSLLGRGGGGGGAPPHDHPVRQRRPARATRRSPGGPWAIATGDHSGNRSARWRIRHALAPASHRPRDLPPGAAAAPAPTLSGGRPIGNNRGAERGGLRGAPGAWHRGVPRHRCDHL